MFVNIKIETREYDRSLRIENKKCKAGELIILPCIEYISKKPNNSGSNNKIILSEKTLVLAWLKGYIIIRLIKEV